MFEQAGLKIDRGIVVDEHQQTSIPGVFACGDIAQRDGIRVTTVVRAHAQGRGAGENAVAFAQGRALTYVPEPVAPLFFKHKDVEIQAIGQPGRQRSRGDDPHKRQRDSLSVCLAGETAIIRQARRESCGASR